MAQSVDRRCPAQGEGEHRRPLRAGVHTTLDHQNQAWAFWTDARNGRSARQQPGRNPICEQSDVFADLYSPNAGGNNGNAPTKGMELFLQTPCPLN